MKIALDQSPGDFSFETRASDGTVVTLHFNVIECSTAVLTSSLKAQAEDGTTDPRYAEKVADLIIPLVWAEGGEIESVPKSRVYARYMEAEIIYAAAGKEQGPSQT